MKLQTLQPRVQRAELLRVPALSTDAVAPRLSGRRLQERNSRILQANPLCVCCQADGRIAAATDVDHRVPLHLGGSDTEDNLQGLCDDCHKAKTAREARDRETGVAMPVINARPMREPVIA